jgi:c-di-GMP-binding flagellar brake protein YcgR
MCLLTGDPYEGNSMTNERRNQERFFLDIQAKISFRFTDDEAEEFLETVAADISAGGAFLQTETSLPLASKVKVEFLLSIENLKKLKFILSVDTLRNLSGQHHVWVQATGVVIRQQEAGVAVIFDKNYQLTPMKPAQK